jgi:hypothetical protein
MLSDLFCDFLVQLEFDILKNSEVPTEHAAEWMSVNCRHGSRYFEYFVYFSESFVCPACLRVQLLMLVI